MTPGAKVQGRALPCWPSRSTNGDGDGCIIPRVLPRADGDTACVGTDARGQRSKGRASYLKASRRRDGRQRIVLVPSGSRSQRHHIALLRFCFLQLQQSVHSRHPAAIRAHGSELTMKLATSIPVGKQQFR